MPHFKITQTISFRTLCLGSLIAAFTGCGDVTEPLPVDTDGDFALDFQDGPYGETEGGGYGSDEGGGYGSDEGGATGEASSDGGDEAGFPGADDPEEPVLACRDMDGEVIAICDDTLGVLADCDAEFATKCELDAGYLDLLDAGEHATAGEVFPCNFANDLLPECGPKFQQACEDINGDFSCIHSLVGVCLDGQCEWAGTPG